MQLHHCPITWAVTACMLALALGACAPRQDQIGACQALGTTPERQVVIIGIDGLRLDAATPALMPFFSSLALRSNATFRSLDVSDRQRQQTYSAPSWISLLTASPAAAHGIRHNDSPGPVLVASVFEQLHQQATLQRSLLLTPWPPLFELLEARLKSLPAERSLALLVGDDAGVERAMQQYWFACQPQLAFVHLGAVDDAGHAAGFDPADASYAQAVRETDQRLKRLWALVIGNQGESSAAPPHRLLIVVSDHGGVGKYHGGFQWHERRVPMLLLAPEDALQPPVNNLAELGRMAIDYLRPLR